MLQLFVLPLVSNISQNQATHLVSVGCGCQICTPERTCEMVPRVAPANSRSSRSTASRRWRHDSLKLLRLDKPDPVASCCSTTLPARARRSRIRPSQRRRSPGPPRRPHRGVGTMAQLSVASWCALTYEIHAGGQLLLHRAGGAGQARASR